MTPGELQMHLERYLEVRRALGFQMGTHEGPLHEFVAFVEDRGLAGPVQAQVAVDWAGSMAPRCGPPGQAQRLSIVRQFLTYLQAIDPQTQVPASGLLPYPARSRPYIYSDKEIDALMDQARAMGPPGSLRPHTHATLIGLLVSCGLRAGEAIRLRKSEVDLATDPPRLHIIETKFRKSRIVPLHSTTADALWVYADQRERLGYSSSCEHFFVSENRGPLNYHLVWQTFVALARKLEIRGPVGERGASLHDLRHTFAVRRMIAWYREGVDVYARLPELSVYLGHLRPEGTYWYLSAAPELLQAAAERFEVHASHGGMP